MKRIPLRQIKAVAVSQISDRLSRMLRGIHPRHIKNLLQLKHLIPLINFCFLFLFLLLYIDPAVIHSSNGINIHRHVAIMHSPNASLYSEQYYQPPPILELTKTYLHDIAATPGGWTRFAVTLLIYICGYPVAGALALTVLTLFFYWIYGLYLNRLSGRPPLVLRLVPAFFIMTMCVWYELDFCAILLPVGGALAFAAIYQQLHPSRIFAAIILLTTLFWITWYSMQWGSLLFLLFILVHELFSDRRRILTAGATAAGNCALLYLLDSRIIPLDMAIRWSNFTSMSGLPLYVIGCFPFFAIIHSLLYRIRNLHTGKILLIAKTVNILLLIGCTVSAGWWLFREPVHRDTRLIAKTMHRIINCRWEDILHEKNEAFFEGFPEKSGQLQLFMVHAVNHALERTGQLGDRLFEFPQATFSYDPLLMLHSMTVQSYVNWIAVLELSMDLGMVGTAEKIAGELMENMGPYPVILHRRALIQAAMGNRETAVVYLNKLSHMPFYRNEAKRLLKTLHNNEAFTSDPRIAAMTRNKDTVDYLQDNNLSCDVILNYLLRSNSGNKSAYDYLMTYYLLNKQFDRVASLTTKAPAFGYTVLPRYWEEARFLYRTFASLNDTSANAVSGAGKETEKRFTEFTKSMLKVKKNPDGAAKLAPLFGDSYFYYSIFSFSPGVFHE